jgi:hypothetical protein
MSDFMRVPDSDAIFRGTVIAAIDTGPLQYLLVAYQIRVRVLHDSARDADQWEPRETFREYVHAPPHIGWRIYSQQHTAYRIVDVSIDEVGTLELTVTAE